MKLINMIVDGKPRLGILTEKGVVDVSTVRPGSEIPCTMMEAIRMGRENALPLLQMAENLATHYLDESTITCVSGEDALMRSAFINTQIFVHRPMISTCGNSAAYLVNL